MSYIVTVDYRTGDSFHTEDIIGAPIESFEWESLEIAKLNSKRIKEHYEWKELYNKWKNKSYNAPKKKPEPPSWRKINTKDYASTNEIPDLINFVLDNGKEVQFWPCWCGYFESLHGAEIRNKNNGDLRFVI